MASSRDPDAAQCAHEQAGHEQAGHGQAGHEQAGHVHGIPDRGGQGGAAEAPTGAREFWEGRYGESAQKWSGRPNADLVRETEGLATGTALDLGCGEGADAIWLAERGWRVTGVDVSATALDRARDHAAAAGVTDRVDWQQHDLAVTFPGGVYDLVCASYLHSPVGLPREQVLRRAAAAVAPGGTLLVLGHEGWASWVTDPPPDVQFPTAHEMIQVLDLAEDGWQVERAESLVRELTGPDGEPGTRRDNVVRVRRSGPDLDRAIPRQADALERLDGDDPDL